MILDVQDFLALSFVDFALIAAAFAIVIMALVSILALILRTILER